MRSQIRSRLRWPLLVAFMAGALVAVPIVALASDRFDDVPDSNDHHDNITAIAEAGITLGCNAEGTLYCPDTVVTRDQMASFIARTAGLGANPPVADADLLDGLDSTGFYAAGSKVADSDLLDGLDSTGFYAAGSKVADSELLDGLDSTQFMRNWSPFLEAHSVDGEFSVTTECAPGMLVTGGGYNIGDSATPSAITGGDGITVTRSGPNSVTGDFGGITTEFGVAGTGWQVDGNSSLATSIIVYVICANV